ncbi:MAG: hypothetical protein V7K48_27590 [Nostoc sp.]|uniref:hypothetical protein n=1 Tax=Nostoc sp. TaxID=1180 RepID=UPI002FF48120
MLIYEIWYFHSRVSLVAEAFGVKKIDQASLIACQELWLAGVLCLEDVLKVQKGIIFTL